MRLVIPHHLSAVWVPYRSRSPYLTGSTGAGLVLAPYAVAEKRGCGCTLTINGVCVEFVTGKAVEKLVGRRACVSIESPVRLGDGLGMSAIASLSLAYFAGGPPLERAGRVAHVAEVFSGTGLGDVAVILAGGPIAVRVRPGAPGIAVVERYPVQGGVRVYLRRVSSLTTPEMLEGLWGRMREKGAELLRWFLRDPTLERLVEAGRRYSEALGFMSAAPGDVRAVLDELVRRGELIGYFVKKSVLAAIAWGDVPELGGGEWVVMEPASSPAMLLD